MTGSTLPSAVLLHLFVEMVGRYEPGLVKEIMAILEAQSFAFAHLSARIGVSEDGRRCYRRVTHTRDDEWDWAIATPALHNGGCVRVTVHKCGFGDITIGVIGTPDVRDGYSFYHATAHGWDGYGGYVYLAGQRTDGHGGWPRLGWEPGDTAALTLDTATNILTLKHRRLRRAFTVSLPGGVSEWFLNVSMEGDGESVAVQPMSTAEYGAFLQ